MEEEEEEEEEEGKGELVPYIRAIEICSTTYQSWYY